MEQPDEIRVQEIRRAMNELTRQAVLLDGDIEKAYLVFEKKMKTLKDKSKKLVLELDELCEG